MNVYEAIRNRRTVKQYTTDEIPREVIERLLEAAVWAPNHHLTEPWRFTVLTGAAKNGLASLRREQVAASLPDAASPSSRIKLDEAYAKMAGSTALIVVSCKEGADSQVAEENRLATAAATQNLLLAATAEGLASFWSSGVAGYAPARDYLGIAEDESIIAVVHLGYSDVERNGRRKSARELTRWLDAPLG